ADGSFFAFVRVDGCTDSLALSTAILDAVDVVTIPGATFGRSGEGYLRLSYGAADEQTLKRACARLREFFAGANGSAAGCRGLKPRPAKSGGMEPGTELTADPDSC
ncbi:MAG: hypothetical protein M3Q85_16000, partial [Acidobacteriota bacterium]|nr:hypothetical protein [Acidobacteriota bacterium]